MCEAGLPDGIDSTTATIVLVLNIFFPGIGTMVAGCAGSTDQVTAILIGVVQFFTSIFIFGYVWAIIWSINLYKQASNQDQNNLKAQVHMQQQQINQMAAAARTNTHPVAQPPPVASYDNNSGSMGHPGAYPASPQAFPPQGAVPQGSYSPSYVPPMQQQPPPPAPSAPDLHQTSHPQK